MLRINIYFRYFILYFVILFSFIFENNISFNNLLLAQIKYENIDNQIAKNWHFGQNCCISFELDTIQQNYSKINTEEGVCSISDNKGNLVFYSDGVNLYNSNHELVENGAGLLGHKSSTQSVLALKKPNTNNLFYIFTMTNIGRNIGFHYSILDIETNQGKGKIIQKNIKIDSLLTERLAATKHANFQDYWVAVRKIGSNEIHTYLLTENGFSPKPTISKVAKYSNNSGSFNTIGQVKFSPDGSRLAIANFGQNLIEIFDFDKSTGKLSNPIYIENKNSNAPYGLEFSPNSNHIYVSYQIKSAIYKYDLSSNNQIEIEKSELKIAAHQDDYFFGSMQLTPNYQIAIANNEDPSIGLIKFPNRIGNNSIYIKDYFTFENAVCKMGLPNFESNLFINYNDSEISLIENSKIEESLLKIVKDAKIIIADNGNQAENYYQFNQNKLLLNLDKEFQAGGVWTKDKVNVENFESFVIIRQAKGNNNLLIDGSPEGADGFAFVFQNEGNNVIGETAAGIGYKGIKNSLAIEFDCFNNAGDFDEVADPNGSHIAIFSNKNLPNSNNHNSSANILSYNLEKEILSENNLYFIKLIYKNKNLKVYFDEYSNLHNQNSQLPKIDLNIDIFEYIGNEHNDKQCFVGLTSSTGNAVQEVEVIKWNIFTDTNFVSSIDNTIDNSQKNYFSDLHIRNNSLCFNFNSNFYKKIPNNSNHYLISISDELGNYFINSIYKIYEGENKIDLAEIDLGKIDLGEINLENELQNKKVIINFKSITQQNQNTENIYETFKLIFEK